MPGGSFSSWSNAAPVPRAKMNFQDYLQDTSQAGNEDYQQVGAGIQPNGQTWLQNAQAGKTMGPADFNPQQSLTGLQTAATGSNPAPLVPPMSGAGVFPVSQLAQQPITPATPVTPAKPRRRMITQSSHSLSGLRAANGAGF